MNKLRVGVLFSGVGSTTKSICESVRHHILDIELKVILTNNNLENTYFRDNSDSLGYNFIQKEYCANNLTRENYLDEVTNLLKYYNLDLLVFAGWNVIVTPTFINNYKKIINLHPALSNSFIGMNCVRKAYDAYQRGEIKYTGSMVHEVSDNLDRGKVLQEVNVPIYENDSYEMLETRLKRSEKGILIQVIQDFINEHNHKLATVTDDVYNGKVRRVEDIGNNCLLLSASNRLSSFDKHICDINNKGAILNALSAWWFNNTSHIIDNHYLYHSGNDMIVKKCRPIKLEIVVRAYMTGSTSTSIWTMYKNGERHIYGLNFRDGYLKNQKLDNIIITPTTKGVNDVPITENEIIEQSYLTREEWEYVSQKALELFRYGQMISDTRGLILVDTKYEFGYYNNKIILMDEIHTCDSSRYWVKDTYLDRFNNGLEPEKLDKDAVRDWVKQRCDPYVDEIPEIPEDVIQKVENVYNRYHNLLTNSEFSCSSDLNIERYFRDIHREVVVILAGSTSDEEHVQKLNKHLKSKNIHSNHYYSSAHKNTRVVLGILEKYESQDRNVVYVTVAGRSNALSGVVASNTRYPVIACPPFKDKVDMQVNINSTLMMPSKVPVMTILEPENVALAISKIFSL